MSWLTHESAHVAAPLKTIANARPHLLTEIEHVIVLPILCPVSVRDMEFFVQVVGEECAKALRHAVTASGEIVFNGLAQRQRIRVTIA
jgi:hypothetical protein